RQRSHAGGRGKAGRTGRNRVPDRGRTIGYDVTPRQAAFIHSAAFETLFGGAAGGGKSHGQLLDALRFAVVYPGSRQLMLRRTMPELERSLVPMSLRLFPQSIASYKVSEHQWQF